MLAARADGDRLAAGFDRLFEALRRLNPADGLSLTTASTLRRLDRCGDHRLSELAAAEGVTQPAMTQLVSRLERDGLAERCPEPADGRVVVVRITEAGREVVRRRRAERAERLAALIEHLPDRDRAAIEAALPALDHLGELLTDES
ncbi:MarR family winged helix-turn-helix transcriptional regulator [Rhizomonospora bruguierae]|uniref:MarR family winged helix-turn-helix transcriptional regulator n=1 Tax=Rhizomonospora bruguierae TaxID=1581705 RepID=UPI0020C15192|nr:MarR family transcriptional regulator [Micromonospora sp. NBRC 107566]